MNYRDERNRQADEFLHRLNDDQIEWGIKEAQGRIELATAMREPFEDEINAIGHPGIEEATTKAGERMVAIICSRQERMYQTALDDLLAERGRRAARRTA